MHKALLICMLYLCGFESLFSQTDKKYFLPNPAPLSEYSQALVAQYWDSTSRENAIVSEKYHVPDTVVFVVRLVQTNGVSHANPARLSCCAFPALGWCSDPVPLEIKNPSLGLDLLGSALRALGGCDTCDTHYWFERMFGIGGDLASLRESAQAVLSTLRQPVKKDTLVQDRAQHGEFGVRGELYDFVDDAIRGAPATITVYRHFVDIRDGVAYLGVVDSLNPIAVMTSTIYGKFHQCCIPTRRYPDYIAFKVEAEGYRGKMIVNMLVEKNQNLNLGEIGMIRTAHYTVDLRDMKTGDVRHQLEKMLNQGGSRGRRPVKPHVWHDPRRVETGSTDLLQGNVYVGVYDPSVGYNVGNKQAHADLGRGRGWIMVDERLAFACVTAGELGVFTMDSSSLETQTVWARSYGVMNCYKGLPANYGQAWNNSVYADVMSASFATAEEVLVDSEGAPFAALFAARCNGDATMTVYPGVWPPKAPVKSRKPISYLQSVTCSGHCNCNKVLTRFEISEICRAVAGMKYVRFGHAAGGCQRGLIEFCESLGMTAEMAKVYYFKGAQVRCLSDVLSKKKALIVVGA